VSCSKKTASEEMLLTKTVITGSDL